MRESWEKLSEKEEEVLKRALEGKTNKEVAVELCVSKRTVDFHLSNIYAKLGVSNRVGAFRAGLAAGFLNLEGVSS